ncbi:MAG: hypothetical protein OEV27_10430 [Nitrospira sp.]|nr:hypothetical protein [Nitrospira sp.]MDH4251593.1 hypothetical protein [Nitrospira sp.]MDH4343845.1 hypothetical protein [Nitrospira sp.]MDH5336845.1 hypothetical protein [Nitrospira sp.]
MADAFFTMNGNVRAIGSMRRGANGQPQSLEASIPDGDTAGIHIEGSGAVRFLGVDTPEKNFSLAGSSSQRRLDSEEWEAYLTDPFLPQFGPFDLDTDLANHLRTRIGVGVGINHRFHGDFAERALIGLIQADMDALGQTSSTFGYFLSFSFEVFDSFGRFLVFINRNQPNGNSPGPRPPTYNERMLEQGAAMPFFVWPNIDPFLESPSILDAVIAPGTASQVAETTSGLRRARELVREARASGIGIFNPSNPLRFEAFEVRYLGRREAPNRAVIDLSRNDTVMLQPQHYFRIPHAEDRLFIPPTFVPLFVSRGWRLEGWA